MIHSARRAVLESLAQFRIQFAYNRWANESIAGALAGLDSVTEKQRAILSHIVAAEQLWYDRIRGLESSMPVWPEFGVERFLEEAIRISQEYSELMSEMSEEDLTRPVAYVNSKGVPWANRVEEILIHVLLHGSYHRGQLALMIREAGEEPVLTDYIHAVRQGLIDSE